MKHKIIVQPQVEDEMVTIYRWIARDSIERADRWFDGLNRAIQSLSILPRRCSRAPESEAFEDQVRQLLYGPRGRACRLLFVIRDEIVHVLHFRHWAQDTLYKEEGR